MPLDSKQQLQQLHCVQRGRGRDQKNDSLHSSLRSSSRSPRRPHTHDDTMGASMSLNASPSASRSGATSTASKHELVQMKDMCWFCSGPEVHPTSATGTLDETRLGVPLPFGLQAIVRPVNRPVGESMPCFLIFKHSEIRIEQNLLVAAPIELPRGTVMKKSQYSQVTFMGELTPIEGPGVVLRFCDEENNESVVVEVSGMTRSVAETIRGILEARGSPMFIADW